MNKQSVLWVVEQKDGDFHVAWRSRAQARSAAAKLKEYIDVRIVKYIREA